MKIRAHHLIREIILMTRNIVDVIIRLIGIKIIVPRMSMTFPLFVLETSGDTMRDHMVPPNSNERRLPSMVNISVETLESIPHLVIIRSGHEPFHVIIGQNLIQRYDHIISTVGVSRTMRPRKVHDLGKGTYGRL
jgi:hypothetical protein